MSGEKRYEYRKHMSLDVRYLVVYATAPVKMIVAFIEVKYIIKGSPTSVWSKTHNASGITQDFYFDYFKQCEKAYAIKFNRVYKLPVSKEISELRNVDRPPQSYMYINEPFYRLCKRLNSLSFFGKGDIIALDEDDIVAIATRELLETFPLFTGNKIKVSNTKSIPHTDKSSFTTLMTLYDCMEELFKVFHFQQKAVLLSNEKLKDYKRSRPCEDEIKEFYDFSLGFWTAMSNAFCEIKEFMEDKTDEPAKKFRPKDEGGNMLFRHVGLLPLVSAVCQIMTVEKNFDYRTILSQYASFLDRNVASKYWAAILWDTNTKRMIVKNGSLTRYLLITMLTPDTLSQKDVKNMVERYVAIFNLHNNKEAEDMIRYVYKRD